EQVLFTAPATGNYTITIEAASVPIGPQGYAVVATGGVGPGVGPQLRYESHRIVDAVPLANDDAVLDPGETITLPVTISNNAGQSLTGVRGELVADRPEWLRITERYAAWPDMSAGELAESLTPHFEMVVSPDAPCGESIGLSLTTYSDQTEAEPNRFGVEIGVKGSNYPGPTLDIPKNFLGTVDSVIEVTEDTELRDLDVTVDISHGNVGEMIVLLTSPEGTTVTLHNRSRAGEANLRVRYDRERLPDGPGDMGDFVGESALGQWTLSISDNRNTSVPAGRLNGWTLHVNGEPSLNCNALECGDAVPGETSGLELERLGSDVKFSWQATVAAAGYHVLESSTITLGDPLLTGRTSGETEFTDIGGAEELPVGLTTYRVRATNSCGWEGP
ncbi:MAG: proprotein convertase P-domain-containing protein, partial [Acidobacteriota bacterium]